MKQEFFNARLLQIQLEMEVWKTRVARYTLDKMGSQFFVEAEANIEALGRGIDNLINEYSKGEETPAAAETKPGTLASAKRILTDMGPPTHVPANKTFVFDLGNYPFSLAMASLRIVLRPAAGDNLERRYTREEMERCWFKTEHEGTFEDFIQGLEGAGEAIRKEASNG